MKIHEYQGKELFRNAGVPVPDGYPVFSVDEAIDAFKKLGKDTVVVKAQIHAGGRGKAGGIKIVKNKDDLLREATNMFGKKLITHQTGPEGKIVKRIYIEEVSEIKKEFYDL